jgi:transglutaminase-like putative cysteine protease
MSNSEVQQERGDCFESAVNLMMTMRRVDPESSYTLVHGYPTGQGPIAGIKHAHAWVEVQDPDGGPVWVLDESNGRSVHMPAAVYYYVGQIDPDECRRYSFESMATTLLEHETYGPWENEQETHA